MFVNKSLLSGSLSEAPLFVTWYQCVVTVLGCYVLRQAARYLPGKISFPELDLDVNIMKEVTIIVFNMQGRGVMITLYFQLLPLSVVFVGMITLNNLCLKNVGVSFYYIGR